MNFLLQSHHHATLITHRDRKEATKNLWQELVKDSSAHRLFDTSVLDIATARTITSWAKSSYNEDRVGLISFHTAGIPAQNALLKILEEPQEGVRFILLTSNKEDLLGTVLSRVQHSPYEYQSVESSTLSDARIFLNTAYSERMKLSCITMLLSQVDEEDRKDREAVRAFILSLADSVSKDIMSARHIPEILEIASYAGDPSSSGKALIEYLSLRLPQTKL